MSKQRDIKQMSQLINEVMGENVMSPNKLNKILHGAKKAHDKHGMDGMLKYLRHITKAPASMQELREFAQSVPRKKSIEHAMRSLKKRK